MPWKFCTACKEISYSAATHYEAWPCPHCGKELRNEPEYDIMQAKALRDQSNDSNPDSKSSEGKEQ